MVVIGLIVFGILISSVTLISITSIFTFSLILIIFDSSKELTNVSISLAFAVFAEVILLSISASIITLFSSSIISL